ncbi:hypothetical protein [Gottfriedia luciferensis]|uniref:hypothetical protein n=1 Tax=Gottfriedia luciferensis TaxID=178774 RepID=UPI001F45FA97|nr:hypothetical protein [Gottfriedia luciferensis]
MLRFFKSKKKVSFNEQLTLLQTIGIKLNENISEELLLKEFSLQEYENDPYLLLMLAMGGEVEIDNIYFNGSNNIWYLDTECIEDTGDYVRIAERIKDLSNGHLEMTEINDVVDIENLEASLSFKLDGKEYHWSLKVDDDWLDITIIYKFNELLKLKSPDKSISIFYLGGQDCLIGIFSKQQVKQLNTLKGIKFEII